MSNLGTRLRHLIELLDGGVNESYDHVAPGYRARFTPVLRALDALGTASIREIACHADMTHSSVSQTVAQMRREGLVVDAPSSDARERAIQASPRLDELRQAISGQWVATALAASSLDAELSVPLQHIVEEAISALVRRPFAARIYEAREAVTPPANTGEQ